MPRKFLSLICVPALLFATAAPAVAQSQQDERVVFYGDLNLNSRAGADTLLRRIEQASDIVCGDRAGPRPISETQSVRSCQVETVEYSVQEVGHPNLLYSYYGYMPEVVIEGSWDPYADPYYEVKPSPTYK